MSNLLEIRDLHVSYGHIKALKGVSLDVKEGSIVAILGANGGGKTTLLKKISGLMNSTSGTVVYKDKDITKLPSEKIAGLGIIQSPEGRQIFTDLTVEDNLRIGAFKVTKGYILVSKIYETTKTKRLNKVLNKMKQTLSDEEIQKSKIFLTRNEIISNNKAKVYKYFPVLEERKKQIANTLSGGEQQMLAISRALMANPKLLILDEPSLGLAPLIVRDIFNIIKEFQQEGVTILIVEQNALQTLKISDYAYVIQVGELIMEGPANELISNPKLVEAYLGK